MMRRLFVEFAAGKARFRIGDRTALDRASLIAILRELPREAGLVITAAGEAPVSITATAIQSAKDAGFTKVSYVPLD